MIQCPEQCWREVSEQSKALPKANPGAPVAIRREVPEAGKAVSDAIFYAVAFPAEARAMGDRQFPTAPENL